MKKLIKKLVEKILLRIHYHIEWMLFERKKTQLFNETRANPEKVYLASPTYIVGAKYITFKGKFSSLPGARIECIDRYAEQEFSPELIIGDGSSLNYYCHIGAIDKIVIGDNVMIGSYVLITDHAHGKMTKEDLDIPVNQRRLFSKGPVIIDDNVWIGEHACIMPGVHIGRCSVIGANAVVTHDVPPYSMVAGCPAKVIKQL